MLAGQRKRGYVCSNDTGVVIGRRPDTVRGPDIMFFDDGKSAKEIAARRLTPKDRLSSPSRSFLLPIDPAASPRKVNQYLCIGVKLVWIVDPEIREVGVHRPGVPMQLLTADDVLTGGDELPGFECRVAEFFELPGETQATWMASEGDSLFLGVVGVLPVQWKRLIRGAVHRRLAGLRVVIAKHVERALAATRRVAPLVNASHRRDP